MFNRKFITAAIATFLTMGTVMLAPMASAITYDSAVTESDQLGGNVTDQQCANLDENLGSALGCDTTDKIIDFTEYSGELEAPDASGYDDALTQSGNAREFIQTVVNFALSFLALISVVIIIYGGILYVLSRGDEEMATKGKKSISYAAIGIIIILGSFAFVNTLLQATGGDGASQIGDTSTDGITITEAGSSFDVDAVLNELESIITGYILSYETLIYVNQEVEFLASIEMPQVVHVQESDQTLGGAIEFGLEFLGGQDSDFADQYTLIDEADIENYIDDLREGIQRIQRRVDSLSDTYESAQSLFNYLRSGLEVSGLDWLFPSAHAELGDDGIDDGNADFQDFKDIVAEPKILGEGCEEITYNNFANYGLGATVFETEVAYIDDAICSKIAEILTAAELDYDDQLTLLLKRFDELGLLFDSSGNPSGSSDLQEILNFFSTTDPTKLRGRLLAAKSTIGNNTVRELTEKMNELYVLIENLRFVQVRLTASTLEGNAPLIVNFDILGTEDPSGRTVESSQIQWDLNGDTNFNLSPEDTPTVGGVFADSATKTYTTPGTYRVRVRVFSSESGIAAGVATLSVLVRPPESTIVLTADDGTPPVTTLADFSNPPNFTDLSEYKVTLAAAKSGVTFDASTSTDGEANPLSFIEWDFGDSQNQSGDFSTNSRVNHKYGEEGAYQLSMIVTDSRGISDRKYFTLHVGSPAARMRCTPNEGIVGTVFSCDGGASSTEVGTIVDYSWSASRSDGATVTLDSNSGTTISHAFDRPGIYTMRLIVTDSSNETDITSTNLFVESQTPVPIFDYEILDSTDPGVYFFDGRDSYDPDEEDDISWDWEFLDAIERVDYTILEGDDDEETMTIRFLEERDFELSLTVSDQHPVDLRKEARLTETIPVPLILSVGLEVEGENYRHLDGNGEADVEFLATSNRATGFEIDYGDGVVDFTEQITQNESIFTHKYEQEGVYYVTLTALDSEDKENSTTERLYVAGADAPIAIMEASAVGEDVGNGARLVGNIRTNFSFDGSRSVNLDGTTRNLNYSWNFGDGTTSNQKVLTHSFEEHRIYIVSLTVKDKNDPEVQSTSTIEIQILSIPPQIRALTVVPQGDTLETPLKVNLTVDVVDDDSSIDFIKAWYYPVNNSSDKRGAVISQNNQVLLTVNTDGSQGEEHEYGFAVEVTSGTDTVSSLDQLESSQLPTLTVVNGPNETPFADFAVDRTSVFIGEEVIFSSTSYDLDGEITSYRWDIEGDGFYNNDPQESPTFAWTFKEFNSEGITVRLKVEDDSGATAESQPLTIYVDAVSDVPEARFVTDVSGTTVNFINSSYIDGENGAELQGIYWDFDTKVDSNGNGIPDDDFDSFEEDPSNNYYTLGQYEVMLTVLDNTGQTDTVTQTISVITSDPPIADFAYNANEREVSFTNRSSADEEYELSIRSYKWDFDLDTDTDEDGDPTNDVDSIQKSPEMEYENYGTFQVKLSIEDDLGQKDSTTKIVDVPSPLGSVQAILTSVPQPNNLGQVILSGDDNVDLTFYFSAEGGSEQYDFTIDKNIFFDTDGDGIRENDIDYESSESGSWRTNFHPSYGQIVAKLSVTDHETGDLGVASLQVVFEGSLGAANLFNVTPNQMIILLLGALLSVVLSITLIFRFKNN